MQTSQCFPFVFNTRIIAGYTLSEAYTTCTWILIHSKKSWSNRPSDNVLSLWDWSFMACCMVGLQCCNINKFHETGWLGGFPASSVDGEHTVWSGCIPEMAIPKPHPPLQTVLSGSFSTDTGTGVGCNSGVRWGDAAGKYPHIRTLHSPAAAFSPPTYPIATPILCVGYPVLFVSFPSSPPTASIRPLNPTRTKSLRTCNSSKPTKHANANRQWATKYYFHEMEETKTSVTSHQNKNQYLKL